MTLDCSSPISITDPITIASSVTVDGGEGTILTGGGLTQIFNVTGGHVLLENLTMQDGSATGLAGLPGAPGAQGEDATVDGDAGTPGTTGSPGTDGRDGLGGALVIESTAALTLANDTFDDDDAVGGDGGDGGFGGNGGSASDVYTGGTTAIAPGDGGDGGAGGDGGSGGDGEGGAIYNAGTLRVIDSNFTDDMATGGKGGFGGPGGNGGDAGQATNLTRTIAWWRTLATVGSGGDGGDSGTSGDGLGGAIYSVGSLTLLSSMISTSGAHGGGCSGSGCSNSTPGDISWVDGGSEGQAWAGVAFSGNGGDGGTGGSGGDGEGGGIYSTGSLSLLQSLVTSNNAVGGNGGDGGSGGSLFFCGGSPVDHGVGNGGEGGDGGAGSSGIGGGIYSSTPITVDGEIPSDNSVNAGGYGFGGDGGTVPDTPGNTCTDGATGTGGTSGIAADPNTLSTAIVVLSGPYVTTPLLPVATAGTPYSAQLSATGGTTPYSWSIVAGSLPDGLMLSPTGAITGTPTSTGVASFTVEVTAANTLSSRATFSISVISGTTGTHTTKVKPTAPAISGGSLTFSTGSTSSASFLSVGTPTPFLTESGSLPAGLSFAPGAAGSGVARIEGTPGATTGGAFPITIRATNSLGIGIMTIPPLGGHLD